MESACQVWESLDSVLNAFTRRVSNEFFLVILVFFFTFTIFLSFFFLATLVPCRLYFVTSLSGRTKSYDNSVFKNLMIILKYLLLIPTLNLYSVKCF